ncbi:MAG TPA: ABC transporter substrate-binding protein [Candidatus Binatia bacterium]|jgi:NitT/TauT family transport system substrate-binding protein
MRYKKQVTTAVLAALLWFSSAAPAADRLRVAYSALNASQSYLWVAQDIGFYRKQGLDVDLLYINSGSMNIAALLGGSIQIAGGGPVSIEARLRGIKLLILANPMPFVAANLVVHPDIKNISDLAGKFAGISRFGSSTDQGFRYLFRKNGLNVDRDLKMLQFGGDSSRVAALKAGKIQYTFLGAAATEQAKSLGFRVMATAQQLAIPFPWTSVVVDENWLPSNKDLAYRYLKSLTEAIWFMKHQRAPTEKVIGKYMKVADSKLIGMEYDFVISLLPDYAAPTLEGTRLILENFGKEYPDAPKRDPKEFVDGSFIDRLKQERFLESLKQ